MTRGINESFFKYKVIAGDEPPKYFKLINEVMEECGIRKNTVYNIINNTRNLKKSKKGIDLKIQKIKIPIRKTVNYSISELNDL